MVRFSSVVITYFVLAVMMFGAGLTEPGSLGILDIFFEVDGGTVETQSEPAGWLGGIGSTLEEVATDIFGPALVIWDAISGLIGALFWPVVVLQGVGAPVEVVLLFGGVPTVAFFMGVLRIVRESA